MRGELSRVSFQGKIATLTLRVPLDEFNESGMKPDDEAIVYKPPTPCNIKKLGNILSARLNSNLIHPAERVVLKAQDLSCLTINKDDKNGN